MQQMVRMALAAVVAVVILFGGSSAVKAEEYSLAVTDLEGMEELQREFGDFMRVLNELTGDTYSFYAVSSRTAAAEALRAGKVDFVLTGPAEYVVLRKRTEAVPVVGFSRPDYFCSVIVMADSDYADIEDLKGEKVAVGDVGSTSKYLAPMQLFKDGGLEPLKDLKPVSVDYKVGWEALKRGDVAALGTTNDKFLVMRAKEKELQPGAFRVIARSRDLPNDVLLAGKHVPAAAREKVSRVFAEHGPELSEAMLKGEDNQKYLGMKFLPKVNDQEYDYVRAMYATIGYPEYAEFVGE